MAATEKQIANLKPIKPGEVRNPKGRGKSLNSKTIITKWLTAAAMVQHPETGEEKKGTILDKMTLAMVRKATSGDVWAFNTLLDRVEGKPVQSTELTGKDGKELPTVLNIMPVGEVIPLSRDETELDVP